MFRAKILSRGFTEGVLVLLKTYGPEGAIRWMETVGRDLGAVEGPGLEGDVFDGLNGFYICPYANDLQDYADLHGGIPPEFYELLEAYENKAASIIFCVFHVAYMTERARRAGRGFTHLASSTTPMNLESYDLKHIEEVGRTKEEMRELLEKVSCIFKYLQPEEK